MSAAQNDGHKVTIAGAGIAALEAVLALRDLVPGVALELGRRSGRPRAGCATGS